MPMRTSSKTIVFTRPFILTGLDGVQPAGTFVVETNEEMLEGLSFLAWRRHSTVIRLHPKPGLALSATIDPEELNRALRRDHAAPGIHLESLIRRSHRDAKKIVLESAASPAG